MSTLKDLIEKHGIPMKVDNKDWDGWVEFVAKNGTYAVGFNESDGASMEKIAGYGDG